MDSSTRAGQQPPISQSRVLPNKEKPNNGLLKQYFSIWNNFPKFWFKTVIMYSSSSHQDNLMHGDTPCAFGCWILYFLLFCVPIFNSRHNGHSGQRILKYLLGIQYWHYFVLLHMRCCRNMIIWLEGNQTRTTITGLISIPDFILTCADIFLLILF